MKKMGLVIFRERIIEVFPNMRNPQSQETEKVASKINKTKNNENPPPFPFPNMLIDLLSFF